MADDQGTKTTSIDNLINELTKQKSPQPAPFVPKPVLPPIAPQPQPFIPKPVAPPMPAPAPAPKPIMPPPFVPKPAPQPMPQPAPVAPSAGVAPVPSPVKEYQSSIRTMSEDMSSIKTGQKPSGVSMPRTIEPPKPIAPPPAGGLPKPPVSPVAPGTQIKLGESQKTGPMAQQKVPAPAPMPKKVEMPQIVIPEGGKKIGSNFLYIGILAIVVLAGVAYWFFMIRTPAVPVAEVTPTPTATPTPVSKTLKEVLGIESVNLDISQDISGNKSITSDVNSIMGTLAVASGKFTQINIVDTNQDNGIFETLNNLWFILDFSHISAPASLYSGPAKGAPDDPVILIYGQKEIFDKKGQINPSAKPEKRIVFVTEVENSTIVSGAMQQWETTIDKDLAGYFFPTPMPKAAVATFGDNVYRDMPIRYKNFPFADRTVDYSIITASNAKSYLVIANSREAMFAIIDTLTQQPVSQSPLVSPTP